jgi:hypothetical protein
LVNQPDIEEAVVCIYPKVSAAFKLRSAAAFGAVSKYGGKGQGDDLPYIIFHILYSVSLIKIL